MLRADTIWNILTTTMPRGEWVHLQEIYELVQSRVGSFSPEDLQPSAPGFKEPKWRRNVRNVLQTRKSRGDIEWDGEARYRLPVERSGTPSGGSVEAYPPVPSDFDQVWEDLGEHLQGFSGHPALASVGFQDVRWIREEGVRLRSRQGIGVISREMVARVWEMLDARGWVSEEHLLQRFRDYLSPILVLLSRLEYVEAVRHRQWVVFLVDRKFSNDDITAAFGVGAQGGIRYSGTAADPNYVLFITSPPDAEGGIHPYRDRWEGDILCYTGEGQTGDQVLRRGNLALQSAGEKGRPIYGFLRDREGELRYLGRFHLEQVDEEQQPDTDRQPRRVYVFRLRPVRRALGAGAEDHLDPDQHEALPSDRMRPSLERLLQVHAPPEDWDWSKAVGELLAFIAASGFVFEPWQVAAYVTALRTKPFVILAGISGTGKSRLPQLVARACGLEYELIPVRPDWTDSSDLLGYTDLSGRFRPGRLLRFARLAEENPSTGHVVVLDEMNLARVEHYFAEVLSRIEERWVEGGLWSCRPLLVGVPADGATSEPDEPWSRVCLPPNLALVGTVNMDESTHGFSRKVLDRAFTLELSETRLDQWRTSGGETPPVTPWPAEVLVPRYTSLPPASDLGPEQRSQVEDAIRALEEVNRSLRMAQLQVGYRVRDEVALFVVNAMDLKDHFSTTSGSPVDPLDLAIAMKVLPRIVGGSGAIRRVLRGLLGWAMHEGQVNEDRADRIVEDWQGAGRPTSLPASAYPYCAARLCLMWERLADDGFTSYWL